MAYWIRNENEPPSPYFDGYTYKCSSCMENNYVTSKFCPNCGEPMDRYVDPIALQLKNEALRSMFEYLNIKNEYTLDKS